MTFHKLAGLLVSVALAAPASAATTWLVPGDGSNGCTTGSPNCNTLALAVTASADGDTIQMAAGSFAAAGINLTKTLMIFGAGMGSTTLTATGTALSIRANGIYISDLAITGGTKGIDFPIPSDGTQIERVAFSGATSRGMDFTTAGGDTVTNVWVNECSISTNTAGGSGIRMASNSRVDGLQIVNTSFTDNNIGLYQANDGNTSRLSNMVVDGASFAGNTFAAIYMEEVRDSTIQRSQFFNNGYGILLFKNYTGSGVAVSNLAIRQNSFTNHTNPALELEVISEGLETPLVVEGNGITHDVSLLGSNSAAIDIALSAAFTHAEVQLTSNFVQLTGFFTTATAAYGILIRGNGPVVLTGNALDGRDVGGSGTTPPTSGVYVQSRHPTFGTIPATASITGTCNRIAYFRNGISVWDQVGVEYGGLLAGTTVSLEGGEFIGNADAAVRTAAAPPTIDVESNYWGCPTGPGILGCDTVVGDVDADPFLATVPACVGCQSNAECDDGLFCNGTETCSGAACVPSSDPCAGGPACGNVCNEATDDCFVSAGTVCRSAAGACDVAETCTGLGGGCPANAVAASGTACRAAAGVCDVAEACDGVGAACPADGVAASGTVCRSATGVCDVAESCDGSGTACPADGFASSSTVCRSSSGICDPAESCTGSSAACPADMLAADGDGDGTCDVQDDCPAIADPGQEDADGDDVGDACDPCTNVRSVYAVKPKLAIVKLLTPVGDDKLKLKGSMTVPALPGDPLFDPRLEGARAVITDSTGVVVLDVTIPAGAYDPVNKVGWKANGSATSFTYVSGAKPVPQPLGIKKFGLKTTSSTPGLIKFTITGKNGAYAVNTANLPLTGTVILDVPFATTGLCGEAPFPGPPNPEGACAVIGNGNGVRCK